MELALSLGAAAKPLEFLGDNPNPNGRSRPCEELDLLPSSPVNTARRPSQIRFPWLIGNWNDEMGCGNGSVRRIDEVDDEVSSPNSEGSSLQMDIGVGGVKRDLEMVEGERVASRCSDDEENGLTRKKLRLSKEQSGFLEESFKEHNTLNPKQKLALAKQLNLRPRQVEVWFQNRRARTKLKQTEVDCEYLKRYCERLTEENKRLHKELQELRVLKTSQPYYMHLPATTLTMCPSCERVATKNPSPPPAVANAAAGSTPQAPEEGHLSSKSKLLPFPPMSQTLPNQPSS